MDGVGTYPFTRPKTLPRPHALCQYQHKWPLAFEKLTIELPMITDATTSYTYKYKAREMWPLILRERTLILIKM